MTMTTTNETEITVDQDVPLVRIVREFDAPPEKVFRAHTDAELFARWNGPRGHQVTVEHFECRTGGSYRFLHDTGDFQAWFHGSFHDVVANELIVQTFTFEGVPEGVALEKLHFEALDDGRTRLTATSLVDSFEDRDAFVASGMEDGVIQGYEQLDDVLAR